LFNSDSGAVRHVDGPFAGDAYLADHLGPKRSGNRVLLIKPECVEHVRGARRIDWLFTLAGHLDEQRLTVSTRPVWSTAQRSLGDDAADSAGAVVLWEADAQNGRAAQTHPRAPRRRAPSTGHCCPH
jgi:hypothetical protein